jgi:hypothetical protein
MGIDFCIRSTEISISNFNEYERINNIYIRKDGKQKRIWSYKDQKNPTGACGEPFRFTGNQPFDLPGGS